MAHPRYKVPSIRGWRPHSHVKAAWLLPLAPANRDTPALNHHLASGEVNECYADVWPEGGSRRYLWGIVWNRHGVYRGGEASSLSMAKRRAEIAARRLGLLPSRFIEPSGPYRSVSVPLASSPSPIPWTAEPIFWLVLADEPAEVAAWEARVGMGRTDAVNWFMGTCWGDAAVCREAERKPFCSDADRLAALRAAFRAEGISLPTSKC